MSKREQEKSIEDTERVAEQAKSVEDKIEAAETLQEVGQQVGNRSSNDGNDGQSTLDEDDEAIVETIVKKVVERLSASGMLNSEH